MELIYMSN